MVSLAFAAGVGTWTGPWASSLEAQDASCEFLDGTTGLNMITLAGGNGTITYLSNPRIGCPDGVRIEADSAISYSAQDLTHLLGSVRFVDGERTLWSEEARYFANTGRLQASGDVLLEDASDGSVIENGDLVYLRANEIRDQADLTVTTALDGVRPRAILPVRAQADSAVADPPASQPDTVVGSDSVAPAVDSLPSQMDSVQPPSDSIPSDSIVGDSIVGDSIVAPAEADGPMAPADTTPPTPYEVVADRLHLVGEGYFEAMGNAVIDRDSLHATADRAEYDEGVGYLLLEGEARVDGADYDLTADAIRLELAGSETRAVEARRNALLTGEQIRLESPVIHLFLTEGRLDRLVAVPMEPSVADSVAPGDTTLLARPVATAEEFVLVADSVDVRAPGEALDRIVAVGQARGESMARDSLNVEKLPPVARRDWMVGDTIVASFRPDTTPEPGPVPAADSAGARQAYVLDRLVATGSARSLYRLVPTEGSLQPGVDPPALHYVTGRRITIIMGAGEVEDMQVEGPTRGYHLEPLRPLPDSAVADSLAIDPAASDSVVADTTSAPEATFGPGPGPRGDAGAARRPSLGGRAAPGFLLPASPPPARPGAPALPRTARPPALRRRP